MRYSMSICHRMKAPSMPIPTSPSPFSRTLATASCPTAGALYATWAHEAIHSTGHSSRLARDLSGGMGAAGDGGRAYAREELVAELGAVLLGDRLAIGSAMANHAAYLGHWAELLQESPRVLLQVLSDARKAADLVCPEAPAADGG